MDYTKKLSDEFLCSIFSHLINPTVVLPPLSGDSSLRLMAVSQRWRRTILESTHLWDTIVIIPTSPVLTLRLVKIAEKWLKAHWNNGHILSVFLLRPRYPVDVDISQPKSRERTQIFRIVEDGILPVARSTESFSCTLSTKDAAEAFFTIPPGIFYGLEHLELSVPMVPDQELARAMKRTIKEELHRFTAFQSLPRLRSAVITLKNGIHPLAFKIPWRQLTKLDMIHTILRPHIFLEVISSSAFSLEDGSFAIRFKKISRSHSSGLQKIFRIAKLPFLQNLRLRLIDPTLDTRIFSCVHLTALCRFRIDLVHDRDEAGWVMSIYENLLSKSSNTLKSLTFWDAQLAGARSEQDLDGLFSMLPKLEYLHLPVGVYIPQNSADKIAQGILLPSLRILDASSPIGLDILDVVRRRNQLAYYRSGWVGSSKLDRGTIGISSYPPFFLHVLLFTSSDYRSKVEVAKRYLLSSSSSQGTSLDIRYANFAV